MHHGTGVNLLSEESFPGHGTGNTERRDPVGLLKNTLCDTCSFSVIKYENLHNRSVLEYVVRCPGVTSAQIQDNLGFHRGDPQHLPERVKISDSLEVLVLLGYLIKEHRRFYPTARASIALQRVPA